jgi:predicted phosphodiesterase
MASVLVVGDAHIDEEQSLDRFISLGKKIDAEQPEYVVLIGDFLSMNCLSEWDKNKRKLMENKRYKKEIDAGNKALDYMCTSSHTQYVYIEGNHENRLTRYFEYDPTFLGTSNIPDDLHLDSRNFTWIPYKECAKIYGVSFTHIPISSNGKATGNPNVAQKALKLFHNSVVFGHTHTLDHAAEHRHGSPHLNQALSVGCFFEHVDAYAQGSMTNYWRGVVDLDIYSENRFDISTTSMRQLYSLYGGTSTKKSKSNAALRTKRISR